MRLYLLGCILLTYTCVDHPLSNAALEEAAAAITAVHPVMLAVALVTADFTSHWNR